MSNIGSYEEKARGFDWSASEKELGYKSGDKINIGWYCCDRICQQGKGKKPALIWEDYQGHIKRFTFDDMRTITNSFAAYFQRLGLKAGDRICIFMDRVPELYFSFLGILKMGGVAQPLFSAFGDESLFTRLENAQTSAILTQKKHAPKVRKILSQLPNLKHIIVVDSDGTGLKEREITYSMEKEPKLDKFDVHPSTAETPSVLHYTSGTTGQPKGAQHVHYSLISQYLTAKWVLDLQENDIYWCNADPGWVTGTSYGIIGPWANGTTQVVLDSGFNAERWYQT
ncbi:MAG TPA: AMP-binding protein, partial [bacterium]